MHSSFCTCANYRTSRTHSLRSFCSVHTCSWPQRYVRVISLLSLHVPILVLTYLWILYSTSHWTIACDSTHLLGWVFSIILHAYSHKTKRWTDARSPKHVDVCRDSARMCMHQYHLRYSCCLTSSVLSATSLYDSSSLWSATGYAIARSAALCFPVTSLHVLGLLVWVFLRAGLLIHNAILLECRQ
jgi:hypothetical protein